MNVSLSTEITIGLDCSSNAASESTFVDLTISTPNNTVCASFSLVHNCPPGLRKLEPARTT